MQSSLQGRFATLANEPMILESAKNFASNHQLASSQLINNQTKKVRSYTPMN